MQRSTEILWQTLAAACVGAIAYCCVLEAEMPSIPTSAPSSAVSNLAGGVAIVSAGIAAFMTGCMFRDPDADWPEPATRPPARSGSGHDVDVVS